MFTAMQFKHINSREKRRHNIKRMCTHGKKIADLPY